MCSTAWGKAVMAQAHASKDHGFDVTRDMPTAADFQALRAGDKDYTLFLDKFVRQVVGARKFDKLAVVMPLTQFVKISDEALALLMYENQEARWKQMLKDAVNKSNLPAKYTDGGCATRATGRSRKSKGWDNLGITQFNNLCGQVQTDRKATNAADFEQQYLAHRRRLRESKSTRASKKQPKHYTSDTVVVDSVFHEMGDELLVVPEGSSTVEV